jgi:hypothetical protein
LIVGRRRGLGLSGRRITVSTVGLLPQLQQLVRETPVGIAVSLTATTDALRNRLMPVNRHAAGRAPGLNVTPPACGGAPPETISWQCLRRWSR